MQLIIILLATVSILTFLSGAIVFFGAKKKEKLRSAWFFIAAFFATVWMASISIFLTAGIDKMDTIDWHVKWTFVSAILIDIAFLAYVIWPEKKGKLVTFGFFVVGMILSALIFIKPALLYSEIILSNTGNTITLNIDVFYILYIMYFCFIVPTIVLTLLKQFVKTSSNRKRGGDLVVMISFGLSSVLVMISEIVLPIMGNWHLIWLGPLALSATIIAFYYSILRYRALNLSSIWLKIFSYIVLLSSVAIVYMIIFSLIFAALFRGSTPSIEVIILNFIMVIIFILLMPALNEVYASIRALIADQKPTNKKDAA
ncbi:hypothetical protein IJH26_02345 [Candidatus Saccharibacteria bacterium]|nr:hypothetical protein [Candidatus Saccharibacteria bacterium]